MCSFLHVPTDHVEKRLDLNEHLVKHKEATYFVRVKGDSMIDAGIHDEDSIVIRRADTAENGSIVVALIAGGVSAIVKSFLTSAS